MSELVKKSIRPCRKVIPRVLDCTLRDGGYYNNWDFSEDMVQRYLNAIAKSGVEIVELGFRSKATEGYMGSCYYTTDVFLKSLDIPSSLEVAVMVNGSDLFGHPWGPVGAIDQLFDNADSSPVDWVRIAAHPDEAVALSPGIKRLQELGYRVGLNIMQISRLTSVEVQKTVGLIADGQAPDILYFADSLGNMNPSQVKRIVEDIRTEWSGTLGIHTHDNMGLALANSMEAIDCGTTWVDGTVFGMGRGAGNASTEDILLQLVSTDSQRFFPTAIFELIRKDFEPLMEKYDWGSNMFYAFAASHDIHPTYVQQMLSTDGYKVDEIMAVLKSLSDDDSKNSFCSDSLQGIVQAHYTNSVGTWSASSWVAGRPVLLLANGPSALEHKSGLLRLIERLNPLVISMNYVPWIESQYVDAYAFCHPTRLASYMDDLGVFKAPIITPLGGLSAKAQASLRNHTVFDFGLSIEDDSVDIFDVGCRLQAPMVAGYALALALAGESSQILLAGFDGYDGNVSKIAGMNRCFEQLRDCAPDMRLTSVTPCPYNVQHDSLYSPRWLEPASHAFRNNHGTIDHHPRKVSV